jgi:hypothetical protein
MKNQHELMIRFVSMRYGLSMETVSKLVLSQQKMRLKRHVLLIWI